MMFRSILVLLISVASTVSVAQLHKGFVRIALADAESDIAMLDANDMLQTVTQDISSTTFSGRLYIREDFSVFATSSDAERGDSEFESNTVGVSYHWKRNDFRLGSGLGLGVQVYEVESAGDSESYLGGLIALGIGRGLTVNLLPSVAIDDADDTSWQFEVIKVYQSDFFFSVGSSSSKSGSSPTTQESNGYTISAGWLF